MKAARRRATQNQARRTAESINKYKKLGAKIVNSDNAIAGRLLKFLPKQGGRGGKKRRKTRKKRGGRRRRRTRRKN